MLVVFLKMALAVVCFVASGGCFAASWEYISVHQVRQARLWLVGWAVMGVAALTTAAST